MGNYDFSGWATKANLKCSDGRTIMKDAFKHNDGETVPLVWNHQHNDPNEVLGHALLENRNEGVYAYCSFNDSESGKTAKLLVQHGDVDALSIYANQLKQYMSNILHGNIREVSLVLAGANPGAYIDSIIMHGEESDEEAIIYTGDNIDLYHADENYESEKEDKNMAKDTLVHAEDEETVADVYNSLSDKQKGVVDFLIGQAVENAMEDEDNDDEDYEEDDEDMKHNVFDNDEQNQGNVLSHSDMEAIISGAKRYGSLKDSFLAHTADYGIENIDWLFPDAKTLNTPPSSLREIPVGFRAL